MNIEKILFNKISSDFSLWKKFKKEKQYYIAKEFKGRVEALLEVYLSLNFETKENSVIQIILKEIRGF